VHTKRADVQNTVDDLPAHFFRFRSHALATPKPLSPQVSSTIYEFASKRPGFAPLLNQEMFSSRSMNATRGFCIGPGLDVETTTEATVFSSAENIDADDPYPRTKIVYHIYVLYIAFFHTLLAKVPVGDSNVE
jgi:hypothetical protein